MSLGSPSRDDGGASGSGSDGNDDSDCGGGSDRTLWMLPALFGDADALDARPEAEAAVTVCGGSVHLGSVHVGYDRKRIEWGRLERAKVEAEDDGKWASAAR